MKTRPKLKKQKLHLLHTKRVSRVRIRPESAIRCSTGKVPFDTYDAAHHMAEQQMNAGRVDAGCHITPYECPECGKWHNANKHIVSPGRACPEAARQVRPFEAPLVASLADILNRS